jgi:hypothetical protein
MAKTTTIQMNKVANLSSMRLRRALRKPTNLGAGADAAATLAKDNVRPSRLYPEETSKGLVRTALYSYAS